jgi:sulfate permease, SulP family
MELVVRFEQQLDAYKSGQYNETQVRREFLAPLFSKRSAGTWATPPASGLIYFNVDHVVETILDRVHAESPPPKLVVLDLSAAPRVDLQSAHTLACMADEITAKGIKFQAVEARSPVRDRLRNEGVDARLGGIDRSTSVADMVDSHQKMG